MDRNGEQWTGDEIDAEARGDAPPAAAIRSNKLMQARIFFQALAVIIVVLILFAAGGK